MFPFIDFVISMSYSVTWGFEIVEILDIALRASLRKKPFSLTDFRNRMLISGLMISALTLLRFWLVKTSLKRVNAYLELLLLRFSTCWIICL